MSLALFFGVLVLLLVLTVPICVSFAFVTLLPSIVDASFPYTADAAVRSMVSGLNNFPLLAIPLFIIAGVIMAKGQISERLFNVFSYFSATEQRVSPAQSPLHACSTVPSPVPAPLLPRPWVLCASPC